MNGVLFYMYRKSAADAGLTRPRGRIPLIATVWRHHAGKESATPTGRRDCTADSRAPVDGRPSARVVPHSDAVLLLGRPSRKLAEAADEEAGATLYVLS